MTFLSKIFNRHKSEALTFKQKLHHFQSLLFANDEALKMMGNLSEIVSSGRPFSRKEIFPIYADIIKNTRGATDNLSAMSGGKYRSVIKRVETIKSECEAILAPAPYCPERWDCDKPNCTDCEKRRMFSPDMPYSYELEKIRENHTREIGGKMSRLCEIHNKLGIPTPDGFCLTSRCFEDFFMEKDLYSRIDDAISSIDFNDNEQVKQASRVIQALIVGSTIPETIEKTIMGEYDHLASKHGNILVSVRSSAIGEDDPHYSFAGLHYTALNVSRANLVDACFEVLISKYLPQSLVYRYMTGLRDSDMPMSIGCQQMIDSNVSGVLFTRDPMGGSKEAIIIQAVRGLGTKVVDGSVEAQQFIVSRSNDHEILGFKPGDQDYRAALRNTDGLYDEEIPEALKGVPCLSQNQIDMIVNLALRIENHFGSPQDIEWAIDGHGRVFILQSRPLAVSEIASVVLDVEDASERDGISRRVLIDGGECASPGVGSGKVFVLEKFKDLVTFPTGGVLVVRKTSPELTSVLHKVTGLVADVGNTTGHLSIIARELQIPVLVNTHDATSRLTNGTLVTVDATANKVYDGSTTGMRSGSDFFLAGDGIFSKSPMYKIWKNVSQLIIPLNLTDPDSSQFVPDNCKTLHDVTRFAHEYSMREMFSLYESAENEYKQAYPLKVPCSTRCSCHRPRRGY